MPVLVPGLNVAVTANTASTTAGSVVQYTVTADNTGQTTDTGVSFTDALAGVLDDAAYNGDAAATAGSVSFASPNLTWTGTLAPGAIGDDHVLGDGATAPTPGTRSCPAR